MKIHDILHHDAIMPDLKSQDKASVLQEIASPISRIINLPEESVVQILMEREQLGSTGIGQGIAIPHGKIKDLEQPVVGFGRSRRGLDFDSIDGRPTHLFFTLITPDQSAGIHLNLLSRISRILKNDGFIRKLMSASSSEDIYSIIKNEDNEF